MACKLWFAVVCCSLQSPSVPCGLNNLGNTCYVNSALQCLFMVPSFRRALYEVEQPLADQAILQQLRQLFLALDFGPRRSVDPTAFAQCLNLDHAVQQVHNLFTAAISVCN